ncbi:MAG: transglutaminase domain-containing protein [Magnetococcales bacterium]|nr:transglutaminase domain-containing protein [Magnetococcales bacterium]
MRSDRRRGGGWRLLTLGWALLFCLAMGWHVHNQILIKESAERLIDGVDQEEEKILALLEGAFSVDATNIKGVAWSSLAHLHGERWFWARFYRLWPINLISPAVVLEHRLAFRGPCGAKSKLMVSLLHASGFQARLTRLNAVDHTPLHSVVEVWFEGRWIALDVAYGMAFRDRSGRLIGAEAMAFKQDLLAWNAAQLRKNTGRWYPSDLFVYENVSAMPLFYLLLKGGEALGVTHRTEAPQFREVLSNWIPEGVLAYDPGFPFFYENPDWIFLFLIMFCLAISGWRWRVAVREGGKESSSCLQT